MADASAVLRANGIVADVGEVLAAVADSGLELAVAAALLMKESGGGHNVWGHDPVDTDGCYTKGGPVTRENYLAVRASPTAGFNGVGPCQLTYVGFWNQADELGRPTGEGCWTPRVNMIVGFREMARCRKVGGGSLREAGAHYNGGRAYAQASSDAQAYGRDLEAQSARWRSLLAGTTASAPSSPQGTYTVASGDTLSGIAARFPGVTWQAIAGANGLADPDRLALGQVLRIPAPAAAPAPAPAPAQEDVVATKEEVADETVRRLLGALLPDLYLNDPNARKLNVADTLAWAAAHAAHARDAANAATAKVAGLESAVAALTHANATGTAVAPTDLQAAVRAGVAQALAESVAVTGSLSVVPTAGPPA